MRGVVCSVGAACLLVLTSWVEAEEVDPFARLQSIRAQFRQGNYERVERTAQALLNQEPSSLIRAECLQYLGAALALMGRSDDAEERFELLLTLQPNFHVDPAEFPTDVIRLFETVRFRVANRLDQIEQRRQQAQEAERLARERRLWEQQAAAIDESVSRYFVLERQRNHWAVALLPFGAGQFQNQQPRKGYAFLATQLAFTAASMGLWLAATLAPETPEDLKQARRVMNGYQIASYVVYGCLAASVLWGIIDGLVYYRPVRERWREMDERQIPGELRRRLRSSPSTP
jgi:tetratricopeptide (TPR) repeat protein